ncbi:hypothetical protein SAMN04490188_4874 [Pseudomonas kilonensis]|uniref:Uncharacterized protein n=1 Tax=Pseudomonas kilonensis TaxID=132476 RepID=A0ABY0ZGQ0_9PSED|nr:hypothetical protein SAMN04490188_4874 [Pseudomonas kilonensis]
MLAIAACQSALLLDVPPSSRASFAPTVWIGVSPQFPGQQKSPVGAKLARDSGGSVCLVVGCAAVIASKLCSHSLNRCQPAISRPTKNPLWEQSLLAIAVGQSALLLDVPPSSRASFAPTVWIGVSPQFPGQQKSPVGAKLARDRSGSACLDVECKAVIASKLCSHSLDRCQPAISRPTKNPLWEQSLLAIAVGQSALMLDVPPSSRASFAPTVWIGASPRFPGQHKSPVGAKLARDSGVSVGLVVGCAAVIANKLCSHSLDRCQPAISRPTQIPCGSKACSR